MQTARTLHLVRVTVGEEEGGLLYGLAIAAGLFAHRPAFALRCLGRFREPVGGVRDAQGRAVGEFSAVQFPLVDLEDVEPVGFEEQPGGGHVQDGVQLLLAACLQNHIQGGGFAAQDDVCAGGVPAFGGLGAEHAPGAESGQDQGGDDQAGQHRAQRARGASSVRSGEGCRKAATSRFLAKV